MKNRVGLGVCLFLCLPYVGGCDRLFGHHDASGADSSGSGSGAGAAAAKKDDVPAFAGFEGEIDLLATPKKSGSTQPVAFNMLVKNDVIRVDLPQDLASSSDAKGFTGGGKVYAILHPAEKKLVVVLDAKQQAITINLDDATEKAKAFQHRDHDHGHGGGQEPSAEPPKVVKTGKMEKVAGYACEDWDVLNADKSKLSLCVADQGASFFHLPLTGIPTEQAWALELLDGKHFPLRGIATDKNGAEAGRVEVTKLDKRTLDAAQFEPPASYKQVTLDEMIQGLMGGGMPPIPSADVPTPKHGGHGGHHHNKH